MEKYYVDKSLTNVAVGRKRPTFLAERLLPVYPSEDISGVYWVLDQNDASLIVNNTERAPGASPHSLYTQPPATSPFQVKDHSLQDSLPDEYNKTAEAALARETQKVEKLTDALDLVKEVNLLTKLAATLTNATTPSIKFDTYTGTTADPIEYILSLYPGIEEDIGVPPNVLAMDVRVARTIINHPSVKERGLPTMGPERYNTGVATMEAILKDLLGLDEVLIAVGSIRNIARKKETKNIVRTWADNMVLGFREEPTLDGFAGMGMHIKWNPDPEEGEDVIMGKLVERERLTGFRKAWGFAVHDYYQQLVTKAGAGRWIPNVLAAI